MEASSRVEAHAFLQEVEQAQSAALATIKDHPFIHGVASGTVSLESLRHFAHAEYWYIRGGVKHFALSIMTAPDLETQRFYTSASAASWNTSNASAPSCRHWGLMSGSLIVPGRLPRR